MLTWLNGVPAWHVSGLEDLKTGHISPCNSKRRRFECCPNTKIRWVVPSWWWLVRRRLVQSSVMATKGASSTSRRSVSGVREENSVSNSVAGGVHADHHAVAPRCFCGVYAIMYKSRTRSNPNRIFLGCPFYKGKEPHCKFFVWVDEHLARIGSNCCICDSRDLVEKHVEVVEEEEENEDELDARMAVLEEKIIALEKKKNPLALWFSVIIFAVVVAFYVASA